MKQIVSDHAVAIGSPFLYEGNDGIEQTEMQMYECGNTGILFALDCDWLIEECDHAETMEIPLAIPSFVDKGTAIVLVDDENEVNKNLMVVGDEHAEQLIDDVIGNMKHEIEQGDWTAIAELLQFVPKEVLNNYIGIN
jgi:hypothetical protein